MNVRRATERDLPQISALLAANDLPATDLADSRPDLFIIEDGARLLGVGGLQPIGSVALLRSVAVVQDKRGTGLGAHLLRALEGHAVEQGIQELVLLTETAEAFFAHHGYRRGDRASMPAGIQATSEFRSLCPASAICMHKKLG